MQWWDDLLSWLGTENGRFVLLGGVVPFAAIVAAGVLAAAIGRGTVRRMLARQDREAKAGVIALLVDAARQASVWSSSSTGERVLLERAIAEADVALRLLPAHGARSAADWAAHEIESLRRASATFSLGFEEPLAAFRDRLLEWHRRPRRARKGFDQDLARWRAEDAEERRRQDSAAELSPTPVIPASPASAPASAPPSAPAPAAPVPAAAGPSATAPAGGAPAASTARVTPPAPAEQVPPAAPAPVAAVPVRHRDHQAGEKPAVEPLRARTPDSRPGEVEPPTDDEFATPVPAMRAGAATE